MPVYYARYVAYKRGISLAQYLTEMVRPIVARDFQQVTQRLTADPGQEDGA